MRECNDDVATCAPNGVKGHRKQSHVWERPSRTHNEKWQRHIVARKEKKGRNTDIMRDREVVNARVSLTQRSVEERKPTFRVSTEDVVPLWSAVDPPRTAASFERNREQPDIRKQRVTVVDDMLTLFASR